MKNFFCFDFSNLRQSPRDSKCIAGEGFLLSAQMYHFKVTFQKKVTLIKNEREALTSDARQNQNIKWNMVIRIGIGWVKYWGEFYM